MMTMKTTTTVTTNTETFELLYDVVLTGVNVLLSSVWNCRRCTLTGIPALY